VKVIPDSSVLIALADEINADLLLLDEKEARK